MVLLLDYTHGAEKTDPLGRRYLKINKNVLNLYFFFPLSQHNTMNGQRSKTNNNGLSSGNIKKLASFFPSSRSTLRPLQTRRDQSKTRKKEHAETFVAS
jgi:hypothetical protein